MNPSTPNTPPAQLPSPRNRRAWGIRIALLGSVSGLLLARIARDLQPGRFMETLAGIQPLFYGGAFAAFGLGLLLAALRWQLAMRAAAEPISFPRASLLVSASHVFNMLFLGSTGGDAAKTALGRRWFGHPIPSLLAACVVDRTLAGGGTILLALATLSLASGHLSGFDLQPPPAETLLLPAALLLAALIALPALQRLSWIREGLRAVRSAFARLARNPRRIAAGATLGLLTQLLWSSILALCLASVTPARLPWIDILWVFPVIAMLAALPVSIAGIGVRETGLQLLLSNHLQPAESVAAGLLTTSVYLGWALASGLANLALEKRFGPTRGPD